MYSPPEVKSQPKPISANNCRKPCETNRCDTGNTADKPKPMKTWVRAPLWVGLAYSGFKTMYAAPVYIFSP